MSKLQRVILLLVSGPVFFLTLFLLSLILKSMGLIQIDAAEIGRAIGLVTISITLFGVFFAIRD